MADVDSSGRGSEAFERRVRRRLEHGGSRSASSSSSSSSSAAPSVDGQQQQQQQPAAPASSTARPVLNEWEEIDFSAEFDTFAQRFVRGEVSESAQLKIDALHDVARCLIGSNILNRENEFGLVLNYGQREIALEAINVSIPGVLGDTDLESYVDEVMSQFRFTKVENNIFIIAQRGYGKSWILSMVCAAFLIHIPGYTIIITGLLEERNYQNFARASDFVKNHWKGKRMIHKDTQQHLNLKHDDGSISKMRWENATTKVVFCALTCERPWGRAPPRASRVA